MFSNTVNIAQGENIYKGDWEAKKYNPGNVVLHNLQYYMLVTDLALVSANIDTEIAQDKWLNVTGGGSNLAALDLTQKAGEDRTYNINGRKINFSNGLFGINEANPALRLHITETGNTADNLMIENTALTSREQARPGIVIKGAYSSGSWSVGAMAYHSLDYTGTSSFNDQGTNELKHTFGIFSAGTTNGVHSPDVFIATRRETNNPRTRFYVGSRYITPSSKRMDIGIETTRVYNSFVQKIDITAPEAEMFNNSISIYLDALNDELIAKYKDNIGTYKDLNFKVNSQNLYAGKRYCLIKPNGEKNNFDTLSQVATSWADGDVLHQFADEINITYTNVNAGIMYAVPSIVWIGNGFKTKVVNINTNGGHGWNIAIGKTCIFSGVNLSSEGVNITGTLVVNGTLYNGNDSTFKIFIQLARSSSYCVSVSGIMCGGTVLPEGVTEPTNLYPSGLTGTGTCFDVTTRGFQVGNISNFINSTTNYPCATYSADSYCDFGDLAIGGGRTFDFCKIKSTRNNNGTNFNTFVARNCTIIHTPIANTHTFWNIPNIILLNCTFISTGYLCASFGGSAGYNIIQGGYYAFAGQVNFAANNYAGLVQISDCTIEATNPNATTDVLVFTNPGSTNVKINNVTFKNAGGRSDIRVAPSNNVEWKNCRFSKGLNHISVSSGTLNDAFMNNPARLNDPKGYLNNSGNGNWFNYIPVTTTEKNALTNVLKNFQVEDITLQELQVYNGSVWKTLLSLI